VPDRIFQKEAFKDKYWEILFICRAVALRSGWRP
jgi:hypothetical protein